MEFQRNGIGFATKTRDELPEGLGLKVSLTTTMRSGILRKTERITTFQFMTTRLALKMPMLKLKEILFTTWTKPITTSILSSSRTSGKFTLDVEEGKRKSQPKTSPSGSRRARCSAFWGLMALERQL